MANEVELIVVSSDDENCESEGFNEYKRDETMYFEESEDESSPSAPLITQSCPLQNNSNSTSVTDHNQISTKEPVLIDEDDSNSQHNGVVKKEFDKSELLLSTACYGSPSSPKIKTGGVSFKSRDKLSRKRKKHDKHKQHLSFKRIKPTPCNSKSEIQNKALVLASNRMQNGVGINNTGMELFKDNNPLQSFLDTLKLLRDKVNEYIGERHVSDLNDQLHKCRASFLNSVNFMTLVEENIEHINYHIDGVQACMFRIVDNLHHNQTQNPSDRPRGVKPVSIVNSRTSTVSSAGNSHTSSLLDFNNRTFLCDVKLESNTSSLSHSDNADDKLSITDDIKAIQESLPQTESVQDSLPQTESIQDSSPQIKSIQDSSPQTARKSFPSPNSSQLLHKSSNQENGDGLSSLPENEISLSSVPETPEEVEKRKRITKLEKLLQKICKHIKKLREQELLSDDDENSPYIREDRMSRKMISVCKLLWKENSARFLTGRPIERKIYYQSTRYTEVNEGVERLVNKTKLFPDFQDIFQLVSKANEAHNLGIPNVDDLARTVFEEIGKKLKAQRIDTYIQHFMEMTEDDGQEYQDITDENVLSRLDQSRERRETEISQILDHYTTIDATKKQSEEPNTKQTSDNEREEEDNDDEEEEEDVNENELSDENAIAVLENEDIEILDDEVSMELDI